MRKFSITNPAFTGEILITYNADNLLVCVDATDTNCMLKHIDWIMSTAPREIKISVLEEMKQWLQKTSCILTEVALNVSFDTFWKLYNYPINRKRAETTYNRLSDSDKLLVIQSIRKYDKYLAQVDWKSKQHPDTYLKNESWKTEFEKLKK